MSNLERDSIDFVAKLLYETRLMFGFNPDPKLIDKLKHNRNKNLVLYELMHSGNIDAYLTRLITGTFSEDVIAIDRLDYSPTALDSFTPKSEFHSKTKGFECHFQLNNNIAHAIFAQSRADRKLLKLAFFEDYTELDFDSKIQEIKKDYTKSLELKLAVALPTGLVEVHKELIQET